MLSSGYYLEASHDVFISDGMTNLLNIIKSSIRLGLVALELFPCPHIFLSGMPPLNKMRRIGGQGRRFKGQRTSFPWWSPNLIPDTTWLSHPQYLPRSQQQITAQLCKVWHKTSEILRAEEARSIKFWPKYYTDIKGRGTIIKGNKLQITRVTLKIMTDDTVISINDTKILLP